MQLANDAYLHHTLLNAPAGVCILDAVSLTVEFTNKKFSEITGKPYETVAGKYYCEAFNEAMPYHEQVLKRVIKKGECCEASSVELTQMRYNTPETVLVDFVYTPIKNNNDAVVKVAVWLSENLPSVKTAKIIKNPEPKNEQMSAALLNIHSMVRQAPVGMCIVSGQPLFVDEVNDFFLEIMGKERTQFFKAPYWEVLAEISQSYEPITTAVFTSGEPYKAHEHQVELIRNGKPETVFVDFVYEPIRDANNRVAAIMIGATEVTDKVLAKHALQNVADEMAVSNEEIMASNDELTIINEELAATQQQLIETLGQVAESEERFRTMAESTGILICVADNSSNALYFNTAWAELTGKSVEDMLKLDWVDLVHPEDREAYLNAYLDSFKYKVPSNGEFRVLDRSGDYRWLLATNTPRFRRDGSFAGYISSCIDITERKRQEEERDLLLDTLKASELKLKQVINQMPAHVVILAGPDMIIESVNQQVFSFWKKTKTIIGKPLLEVLPELKGQQFPKQLDEVFITGEAIYQKESPVDLENGNGTKRKAFVDYSYQPIWGADGIPTGVLVISFEVTDKVNSRNLLEKYATDLQVTNEELATLNEELKVTNEELMATNEELAEIQKNLEKGNN